MVGFLAAPSDVVEKGAEQVLGVVGQTILGAIAILGIGIAAFAVLKMLSVQDKATARIDKQNERMEKQSAKVADLVSSMTKTFQSVDSALTELVRAERDSQSQARELMNLLQQMKQSQDTIIRDAVLAARGGFQPPGGYRSPGGD